MRVFVFGAGASKSYGDSPSGRRMPIARDFFQTFDGMALSANPWVLIGSILVYVQDWLNRSDADAYLRSGIDIEDLHSRIEADRDATMAGGDMVAANIPYRAYNELLFLFAAVINDIQNGPPSEAHAGLVAGLAPDDVLVTFNWDTLLDRALATHTPWRPDRGYGVRPRAIFADGWREPDGADDDRSANKLLKLHGSTNWLTAYSVTDGNGRIVPGQAADPGDFAVFESASAPYACFKGRYMPGYQPFSYGYYPPNLDFPGRAASPGRLFIRMTPRYPWTIEGTAPDDGLVSMPLIIPPVRNKTYDFFGDLFRNLWSQAEDALVQADEIVVIGYSFPRTDTLTDSLFRRAFLRRDRMPLVTVIDPAPTPVGNRFADEYGIAGRHLQVRQERFKVDTDLSPR